jgi:hypothetical protein
MVNCGVLFEVRTGLPRQQPPLAPQNTLTTYPHLVPRTRMSRSCIPPLPPAHPWHVVGLLYFYQFNNIFLSTPIISQLTFYLQVVQLKNYTSISQIHACNMSYSHRPFITILIFGEEYKLWTFSTCLFFCYFASVRSKYSAQNPVKLYSSTDVRNQVSHSQEQQVKLFYNCEISSSHGGEYEVQNLLLGCTAV